MHAGRLEVHKSFHKNLKYRCNAEDCLAEMETKEALEGHQKETGHVGMTLIESLDYVSVFFLLNVSNFNVYRPQ